MTKYLSPFIFFITAVICAQGQGGLEGIYVERFYKFSKHANADTLHDGYLAKGSITYRIYVDLKPGYTFQAAYGAPGHPLYFQTDRKFYNHREHGNACPAFIPEQTLSKSLVALDSWLTAGWAAENHLAIPICFDDTSHDDYISFPNELFTSRDSHSFPQTDGFQRSEAVFPNITFYNMDEAKSAIYSDENQSRIQIENGAWACMGKGVKGYDSEGYNLVLIAQLTTDGDFSYGLNLMIGTPDGKSERYVYQNPGQDELEFQALRRIPSKKVSKHVKIDD